MGKIIRIPEYDGLLKVGGKFVCTQLRDGKVIDKWESKNIVVNQGLNYMLNTALDAQAAQSAWYVGIFSGNYTPLATDTAATIAANATESAAYSNSTTRPAWRLPSGGSTAQNLTNSASQATFVMSAAVTIYGALLCSSNVINGTAGVLMAASQFATARTLASGDNLLVTYSLSAVSG